MPATMHYTKQKAATESKELPLRDHIAKVLNAYFENMGDEIPHDLYELVMTEVEYPMIDAVMQYTNQNQSQSAKILGINRGTFRKKLAYYNML